MGDLFGIQTELKPTVIMKTNQCEKSIKYIWQPVQTIATISVAITGFEGFSFRKEIVV